MRILVTGSAGFIGSHVLDKLLDLGHRPILLDNMSTGKEKNIPRHRMIPADLNKIDITNAHDVEMLIFHERPEAIIHLAAQAAISTSIDDPVLDMKVNGLGTINLLRSALRYGVRRFIFSSTSAVYDDKFRSISPIDERDPLFPNSPYGISKLAAEGYVRTMFPGSVILRFGNVYGPRQVSIGGNQVVPLMIRHLECGDDFSIHGSGNQQRDFVYVDDIVDAIVKSLDGKPGTYNVGTNQAVSVNSVGEILRKRYGQSGFPWKHTDQEDPRPYVCLSNELARTHLGWEPRVDIVDGLNRTVDWFKETQTK